MSREAMKVALEALKQIDEAMPFPVAKLAQKVLREALAEQPEPVQQDQHEFTLRGVLASELKCWHRLTEDEANNLLAFFKRTTQQPAQRTWVGLTDEEVVNRANAEVFAEAFARGVAWAELKLKEKNT